GLRPAVSRPGAAAEGTAAPVKLEKHHHVARFHSGAPELDLWLQKYAWMNHAAGNARVFVACRGDHVVGYYTLSSAGVAQESAPADLKKGGPPKEIPCLLLGRMAVDLAEQGRGLGRSLLIDALLRVARLSDDLGFRALLIHARDDDARRWYQHQARTFRQSPSDPLHLFLPIKELRRIASTE
ncbi:MAG: GNAT family N-acetyltransferase, partial [Actinobacteria bacterium]|nr:GNAT family N-acetyltransferase [Actinomycetota bacterium]